MIRIEFNEGDLGDSRNLYDGRHLEIRQSGSQIRFYEVDRIKNKEYCLTRETVQWLVRKRRIPRKQVVSKALKGNKSIFLNPLKTQS